MRWSVMTTFVCASDFWEMHYIAMLGEVSFMLKKEQKSHKDNKTNFLVSGCNHFRRRWGWDPPRRMFVSMHLYDTCLFHQKAYSISHAILSFQLVTQALRGCSKIWLSKRALTAVPCDSTGGHPSHAASVAECLLILPSEHLLGVDFAVVQ